MSTDLANEVAAVDSEVQQEVAGNSVAENPTAVQPETAAKTSKSDGRKSRKKKRTYPVPESKLSYPFPEDMEPWTTDFGKLSSDDFKTEEEFDKWECYVFYPVVVEHIKRQIAELETKRLAPVLKKQQALQVKIEKADEVCETLEISDESQKAAMGQALGILDSALGEGLTEEQLLQAMQMLAQSRQQAELE